MAATAASSLQMATTKRPSISAASTKVGTNPRNNASWDKIACTPRLSNLGCLRNNKTALLPTSKKSFYFSTRAMSEESSQNNKASSGLPIDLRGCWLIFLL